MVILLRWLGFLRTACVVLGVLCAALGGAWAQTPNTASLPNALPAASANSVEQPVQQFTLANGLTVLVQPNPRAPTVVHMLWVKVGGMDEVDGHSGLAHALEHMMFKGTPSLKPGEFSRRIAALGGRDNAFTTRDATAYHQQIPAAALPEVMRLEADRFANTQWTDEEFQREIEVVKEERRLRTDDVPHARLYELANATTFLTSPYRRPVVGWMQDLDAMTPNDARQFYRQWYVPGNAAVVVVGDVDVVQVKQWAQQYYGSIPARPVPARVLRPEPAQVGMRRTELQATAQQAYVSLGFKVPQMQPQGLLELQNPDANTPEAAQTRDALALTVLAAVLDGYSGARLERALRQGPARVADQVGASHGLWGRGPQLFVLDGVPAQGKTAEQVAVALRQQVALVAQRGVGPQELARVKTQWVAAETYKRDGLFSQARVLGAYWVNGFAPETSTTLLAQLQRVTAEQVQQVAARYFGNDQLNLAVLVPQPPAKAGPATPARPAPAAPSVLRH